MTTYIYCEGLPLEHKKQNEDEKYDRNKFGDGSQNVEKCRLMNPFQDDVIHKPDHKGAAYDGKKIVPACEFSREKVIKGIHEKYGITHIAENIAQIPYTKL